MLADKRLPEKPGGRHGLSEFVPDAASAKIAEPAGHPPAYFAVIRRFASAVNARVDPSQVSAAASLMRFHRA